MLDLFLIFAGVVALHLCFNTLTLIPKWEFYGQSEGFTNGLWEFLGA